MTTEIKKIVLDLDGKEVELTTAQAKALQVKLNELFSSDKIYVPQPYPVYPVYPIYYDENIPIMKPWITFEPNTTYNSGENTDNMTVTIKEVPETFTVCKITV